MRCGALAFFVVALVASRPALAQPTLALTVDECVAVEPSDVRKLVEIELHTHVLDDGLTKVAVRCRDNVVELTVVDPVTGKSLVRSIDVMAAAPKARARLLALAIAELVSASWTELETNPTPAVPPAGPPPEPAAKAAAREVVHARVPALASEPSHPLRVAALIDRRAFLARTAWVTGFGVRVAQDRELLGWTADMTASQGTRDSSLGEVALDVVGVALGVTIGHRWSIASARGAAGLRFGAARLSGVPRGEDVEGRSVRGPWGGPFLSGSVSIVPIKPLLIEASIESGYVIAPVHARVDGERQASVGGVWLGGALSLGVVL